MDEVQEDELRPVTALFADIVGSTALAETLDPAEVKALIGDSVSRMTAVAESYGGFVQAYQGDGICVFFGVPAAHEDDPERAALAALEIVAVVREYADEIAAAWRIQEFNVRVGVNTGRAAVGLVGAGSPHPVALGDATNVASRLQSAAEPGAILVGPQTATRLAGRFDLLPIEPLSLKGKAEAVDAARLIGPPRERSVDTTAHFLGREDEVVLMRDVLQGLERGRGQVLTVLGPAGIGKTALVTSLRSERGGTVRWLRGRARPYAASVSYAALIDALREWLDVSLADPGIVIRTRLRARACDILATESLEALSGLLGLESVSAASPREAILAWIEALAREAPVALILDDLQWADASTGDVVEELLELTERLPLLLILAMRQDPDSEGWRWRLRVLSEYSHRSTELILGPLADADAAGLVQMLLPAGDDEMRSQIVAEAEGNPLYLVELVREVEHGDYERNRTWTLTAASTGTLPSPLEGLLISRIDRLPSGARRLAQSSAVLGKTFAVPVLRAMADDDAFDDDLKSLMRAEVVRETRRFPALECGFTHGLLREAALSTLPASRLRELYGRAATVIEQEIGEHSDEQIELLAECYARSDNLKRALECLKRAASRASEQGEEARATELRRRADKVAARIESD